MNDHSELAEARMIAIGAQGWNYDAWKGSFFPRDARPDEYLALYARVFDTVEVDSTFYATPAESAVRGWIRKTPDGFTFSPKLPRSITHEARLRDSGGELAHFCERVRLFGDKLGVVLVQLPPDFSVAQFGVLERFLSSLPQDIRFAVEFRDPDWINDATVELFARFGVAIALVDSEWISRERSFAIAVRPTAGFAYARWLGPRVLTDFSRIQIDKDAELREWAATLQALSSRVGRIFGYFNNHYQGHSPASANRLKQLLGQEPVDPSVLVRQPSLF
jgi:uncharacterized protein YecE (DUF72 family)